MNLNANSFRSPGLVVDLLIWGSHIGECLIELKGLMGSNGQGWKSMFQQSRAMQYTLSGFNLQLGPAP